MATLKEFLEDSELGSYHKVFPALTIPTIETQDADGYLKVMALAAIEQVKYLETFSGIPLEVLYENIGQRHKASNLLAMSSFRKLPGGSGSGLGLVAMPGETGGGMYEHAFLNLPTISTTEEESFPQALWNVQVSVIRRQTDWLKTLSGIYAEKLQELPQEPSFLQIFLDTVVEFVAGEVLRRLVHLLPGETPPEEWAEAAVSFVGEFILNAWEYLKKYYNETCKILDQMCEENDELLSLVKNSENYMLRAAALTQHEATAKNIIELITGLEDKASKIIPSENTSLSDVVAAIEALAMRDEVIDFGGVHVSMHSKVITEP